LKILNDYILHHTKAEHRNVAARWAKHVEKGEGNLMSSPDSCFVAAGVEKVVEVVKTGCEPSLPSSIRRRIVASWQRESRR
jgi:hypothetical protein